MKHRFLKYGFKNLEVICIFKLIKARNSCIHSLIHSFALSFIPYILNKKSFKLDESRSQVENVEYLNVSPIHLNEFIKIFLFVWHQGMA